MKRDDTVIVIGSGPGSEMSGAEIDLHPVVRMWNHDWQPADRYGSRYDYGLITMLDDAHLASRMPKKAWLFYDITHHQKATEVNGIPVSFINHRKWHGRAEACGAKPGSSDRSIKFTRGFSAVAGTIEKLRPRRIIVIGMDILRNGVTGSQYFDPAALPYYVKAYPSIAVACPWWGRNELPAGLRGEGPHDYTAESAIIRDLAAEAGTQLVWE